MQATIGLVGDRSATVPAHRAIPIALGDAARALGIGVEHRWIPTEAAIAPERYAGVDGLWCVPGGPYRSFQGALTAIRRARESQLPFLGTCAGFQHAVVEFARNVLGWHDADHGEVEPDAPRAVVTALECGILDGEATIRLLPGTRVAAAYGGRETVRETYLCRYGVNPAFRLAMLSGPLSETATDERGDVRAVELADHPFFVATLFQPERAALQGHPAPLVAAFVAACARSR
jgi:CTP synthase (UTP-ammonia lyase)